MKFQFHPLSDSLFEQYYNMSEEKLKALGIVQCVADADLGYPCRVTLEDAKKGETLFLLNHQHLDVSNPYRSAHAIFVRDNASSAYLPPNTVPEIIKNRPLLSVRAFDYESMMMLAEVASGDKVGDLVSAFLNDNLCKFVHVHSTQRGCFLAAATRSD